MKKIHFFLVCLSFVFLPGAAIAGFGEGYKAYVNEDYAGALSEWKPLADQGDAIARFSIGMMYYEGQGVAQDYKEAVRYLQLGADQGHSLSQERLGYFYRRGLGVAKDLDKVVHYYRLAATQRNKDAQAALGLLYFRGEDNLKSDFVEAVKWFRLAAAQGDEFSQFQLGAMYTLGQGVPKDYPEAVKWYRIAASQGHSPSQAMLGSMYANGNGVPLSKVAGYALMNLSAASDKSVEGGASNLRENLSELMSDKEIEAAQSLTRELAKPGALLKALDKYIKRPLIREKAVSLDVPNMNGNDISTMSEDNFPERPATRVGLISCNTRCVNAACWRTYDNGRKVQFQAKSVFDSFTSEWKFDSGGC